MPELVPFGDDLGPLKVIQVWEPSLSLEGVLVVDNVAAGPSIGGLRMAPDVSIEECFRLARAMTRLLRDEALRAELIARGRRNRGRFSWWACAQTVMEALEAVARADA